MFRNRARDVTIKFVHKKKRINRTKKANQTVRNREIKNLQKRQRLLCITTRCLN